TASDYTRSLSETIVAIARHSSSVIVGRGAHLILDPERSLRVRAYAPLEKRNEYVSEREGMSPWEAKAKVERVDAERRDFFQKHFDTDITDPLNYDLLINTSTMSLAAAAEVVGSAYGVRFS
ncbi:MAG: cytidylate kinase-like family protein, partial [Polyangiaceae bacterium]|nr:cytidylate kinase-like family protein [Polyangiaceae bacterium]